jgi:hypothetical protein
LGGLQRPEVPRGAQRDLVDALHALHHEAGWPSLRTLAREAGCSHTTVSTVFSSPRVPSWGVLELVVEAMGGDTGEFHRLWLAASSPASTSGPRIAGRKEELAVVRRHLEQGTGLLLVTGEAGIGKTRLVDTAVASTSDVFVARGSALPLSVQVPLLPITDVLRTVYRVDQGQWLKEALYDCPTYVPAVLRRLLPELEEAADALMVFDDDWWRQRLFSAVATTWAALAAARPLAVLVEDLHWADSTTLDLLEHLLTAGPGLPLVGTWRQDDPTVPIPVLDWVTRVRRLSVVDELVLHPLTRDGTAQQLTLLTGDDPDPASVDRIYRRTAGQPLFTEQLLAQTDDDQPLPDLLADLLDRRLDGLDDPAWRIARALGVADRPLTDALLREVTALASGELTTGLHGLADRRLLCPTASRDAELRHPLLAEAIRRRLVGPELVDEHHKMGAALASTPGAEPAEIAEHWRRADDPRNEIVWRIHAARAAAQRFAATEESDQWLRVLELWPDRADVAGSPRVTQTGAYIAALDALKAALRFDRAADLSSEAISRVTEVPAQDRAALLVRAAEFRGVRESPEVGLKVLEQALDLYGRLPPDEEYVRALDVQHNQLSLQGRFDEAHKVAATAVRAAEEIGVPHLLRQMLAIRGWHEAEAGDVAQGLQTMAKAQALLPSGADPLGDIRISVFHTDLLLHSGASAEEVEAAGAPGLAAAASTGIDSFQPVLIRTNICQALTREGFIGRAAALIDPLTEGPYDLDRSPLHLERARLDSLRGLHDAAQARLATLREDKTSSLYHAGMPAVRIEVVDYVASIDLWGGEPERALALLQPFLDEVVGTGVDSLLASTFLLAARAAADIAERDSRTKARSDSYLPNLRRLLDRASEDPFTTSSGADGPAQHRAWHAETARLAGQRSLPLWSTAASEWDQVNRPHDAAYCRWRGAQAALATGHGTVALRVLRHAARQAREHAPLSVAITETKAQAGPQQNR